MQPEALIGEKVPSRQEISKVVFGYVSEFFYVDVSSIAESTRFEDDLSGDAISFTDCVDALEEEFTERALGFSIDTQERDELETVGDLIDMIAHLVIPTRNTGKNND